MIIKLERFAWLGNRPVATEFEGTKEEFEFLQNIYFIEGKKLKKKVLS